jgi:hypothetical protein
LVDAAGAVEDSTTGSVSRKALDPGTVVVEGVLGVVCATGVAVVVRPD